MKDSLLQLLQALLEVAIVFVTPYAIKALKAIEAKGIAVAGESNYNFGKTFIEDIIKARPDVFSEDELVKLLDELDNKLGDKLSHDEVKQIVDSVMKDLQKEITPSMPTTSTEQK